MPINYKLHYVGWWRQFSEYIRFERAENRCECTGECGTHHNGRCTARNGERGKMGRNGIWHSTDEIHALNSAEGMANYPDFDFVGSKVCLTVAHLDRDEDICDCRQFHNVKCASQSHVKAMCQFCHNHYDLPSRLQSRANTLSIKKDSERGLFL